MNAMIGLLASLVIGVDSGSAGAVERTANYQPPGSPGGANNWAGETQPLKTRWGSPPTNNVTTGENARYSGAPVNPIPTPVPVGGSSTAVPTSATTTSAFPGSTLGTIPSSGTPSSTIATSPPSPFPGSSSSSAFPGSTLPGSSFSGSSTTSSGPYPAMTAPPSLGAGPRITQPQPYSALPRESNISARMPAEPNLPTPNLGTVPGYNNGPGYNTNAYGYNGQPTYQQPGYGQTQLAQMNYPPPPTTTATAAGPAFPGSYANNGQQLPQANYQVNPQPTTNAGMNPAVAVNPTKEPVSASDKAPAKQSDGPYLALALILLCTSLACNVYFGWSKYQMQERYRLLLVDRGGYAA